jgi:hypothetical protein
MEIRGEDETEDRSLPPPTMGSMQIAGSTGFGHSIEYMSQAYLRKRYSEIDIEDVSPDTNKYHPLPIFLKVVSLSNCLYIRVSFLSYLKAIKPLI